MKDLIAKLTMDANCAMGAIWMHIDAQAARIAELEAQIAAASALVVDPVAPLRNLTAWQELRADVLHGLDGLDNDQTNIVLGAIDYYMPDADSTALQAPVREVPGYKLVPLEVTDAMLEAWKHELCIPVGSSPEAKARRAYKAMLSAAPLPAAPVQQEPKP